MLDRISRVNCKFDEKYPRGGFRKCNNALVREPHQRIGMNSLNNQLNQALFSWASSRA